MIDDNEINKSKYKIEYLGEKLSKDLKFHKIIFIGGIGVGKAAIINKLMNKEINKEYAPTMSIDIKNLQMKVNDKIIQIQIWDCCGNDKYAQSMPNLFKNTSITILVYSINDRDSFEDLKIWYNLVKEYSFDNIIFLIGNKSDLEEEREITKENVETFKNDYDDIKIFFETSALNHENMDKLLDNIVISIYEKDINDENKLDNAIKGGRIALNKEEFTKKRKKKKKKFC
jgi:small GTP-binding protein